MGFDSNVVRSKHETYEDIDFQYLHWASGDVLNHDELRRKFFTSGRLNEEDVKDLMNRYPELKPGNDPDWYEVYYPDVNSSRCILREINYKLKTIE